MYHMQAESGHKPMTEHEDELRKVQQECNQECAARYQKLHSELVAAKKTHQSEIEDWIKAMASTKYDVMRMEELYQQSQKELNLIRNQNQTLRRQLETEQKTVRDYRGEERTTAKESLLRQLEERLRGAEKERDSLKKQNQAFAIQNRQSSSTRSTFSIVQGDNQPLRSRIRQLEKERQDAALNAEVAKRERQNLITHSRQLEMQLDIARKELGQIEGYKQKLQRVTSNFNHSQALVAARTRELRGVQRFLGTADEFSGADLIRDLEQLNAEIVQLACEMAEMAEAFSEQKKKGDRQDIEIFETVKKTIGTRLVELLSRSPKGREARIVIQTAFQAAIVAHAHWILSAWFFEDRKKNEQINEIYDSIRNAGKFPKPSPARKLLPTPRIEGQAVAGRWRQLTRSHLQSRLPKQPQDLQPSLVETAANITVLANYATVAEVVVPQIRKRFGRRINTIIRLAQSLNKKAGEGVTSCDLEFLHVAPNTAYNPSDMEDGFKVGFGTEAESVICTTDLGLLRSEKSSEAEGQRRVSVLVKPKVVLPSGLKILDI